jgi:hypothetical protein
VIEPFTRLKETVCFSECPSPYRPRGSEGVGKEARSRATTVHCDIGVHALLGCARKRVPCQGPSTRTGSGMFVFSLVRCGARMAELKRR